MKKRNLNHNSSGQVIIITALLVATLLLSTAIYVFETEKEVPTVSTIEDNVFPAYQQSIRNTLISALANVTNGGNPGVLSRDLNKLTSAITNDSYHAILQMNYAPLNAAPYQNGFWVSWGTNGQGVSSVCASFSFNSSGPSTSSSLGYDVNVTTAADLSGYLQVNSNYTQVNLVVNMLNEGKPALAQNFTFYFENAAGSWVKADSPVITDFGNGTYAVSFTIETVQSNNPLPISMVCEDQRSITVVANATCTNIG
jgi:hypothetical protein